MSSGYAAELYVFMPALKGALTIRQQILGNDDPSTLMSMNRLTYLLSLN